MKEQDTENTIIIRQATSADVQLLLEMGRKTFYDTFAAVNTKEDMDMYLTESFNEVQVKSEIEDKRNTFLVAEHGKTAVGYSKLRRIEPPAELEDKNSVEIERVYAVKEFIGKKVGRSLMDACTDLAKAEGFDTVWLAVWEHNERAKAFYEKCGFEKFGEHPFVLGTDHQTDHMLKKKLF